MSKRKQNTYAVAPREYRLGGTPLDEAIVATAPLIMRMRDAGVQHPTAVFLTDGCSGSGPISYYGASLNGSEGGYYANAILKIGNKIVEGKNDTDRLLNWLRQATGCRTIGYFLTDNGHYATQYMNDHDKAVTAYHEGGHALVAAAMNHTDPVTKVTILPRTNGAGGFTLFTPTEERLESGLYSKRYLEAQLAVAYGVAGRIAHDVEQARAVVIIRHLELRHVEITNDEVSEGRGRAASEQFGDGTVRKRGRRHLHEIEDGWPAIACSGVDELDAGADVIPAETPREGGMSASPPMMSTGANAMRACALSRSHWLE